MTAQHTPGDVPGSSTRPTAGHTPIDRASGSAVTGTESMNVQTAPELSDADVAQIAQRPDVLRWRQLSIACLLGLILLCTGWELAWAPLRPGGSWWVLKVLPLLAMLPGLLKSRLYSYQWASMAILLYVTEGTVRATSDSNPVSIALAWAETALSITLFCALLMYTRAFKRPKAPAGTPGGSSGRAD